MRIIVVDDEKPALIKFKKIFNDIENIYLVNCYNNPIDAIENVIEDDPDIAFLDIEMPEMDGIMLAEKLINIIPNIEIIFVTAFDKYVLQAFQTYAIGYLLKPVQQEDIIKQLDRINNRKNTIKVTTPILHISSFGEFICCFDTEGKKPISFRTEKAEELLAFLLSQSGKAILKDNICDTLWPEMDIQRATKNFYTTCYYLRKLFSDCGFPELIIRRSNTYCLNTDYFNSDFTYFDYVANNYKNKEVNLSSIEKAVILYNGFFMGDKDYIWCNDIQTHYERCFEKIALHLADLYIENNCDEKAEAVLLKLLKQDSFCESACDKLIKIYLKDNKKSAAIKLYQNFSSSYIAEFNENPDVRLTF